jgi:hypothetical protein
MPRLGSWQRAALPQTKRATTTNFDVDLPDPTETYKPSRIHTAAPNQPNPTKTTSMLHAVHGSLS